MAGSVEFPVSGDLQIIDDDSWKIKLKEDIHWKHSLEDGIIEADIMKGQNWENEIETVYIVKIKKSDICR